LWDMLMRTLWVVIEKSPGQVIFSLSLEELYHGKAANKL
jgi:hypothetical protein